jgi:hypothetical protein
MAALSIRAGRRRAMRQGHTLSTAPRHGYTRLPTHMSDCDERTRAHQSLPSLLSAYRMRGW